MTDTKSPQTADVKSALAKLEDILNEYLVKKAPFQLPKGLKDFIVTFAPWLTVVALILAIPGLLLLLGVGTAMMPLGYLGGVRAGATFSLTMVFTIITLVLEVLALPGLFKRSKGGWNFVFYASLVGVIQNVVTFNLGGLIIGSLIGFYVLFQVREYYK